MKVRNKRKEAVVVVPADYPAFEVTASGVSPDLPDEVAESLLAQEDNWSAVDSKSNAKKDGE